MDNCACAWEFDEGENDLTKPYYVPYGWRQTHWCRLHMEAEIAKQGQAAGAEQSTGNRLAGVGANRQRDGKEGRSGMTQTVVITADDKHDVDAMGRGECPCNICVPCENCKDDAWLHGELGCAAYVLAGDGYCGCKRIRVEVNAKAGIQ